MSDELDQLTDAALSERVAVECAEIPPLFVIMKRGLFYRPNANGYTSSLSDAWQVPESVADEHVYPHDEPVTKKRIPFPPFATSADAVLPFLGAYPFVDCNRDDGAWTVGVGDYETMDAEYATAPTFARAACIALLRAKRAEKGGQ